MGDRSRTGGGPSRALGARPALPHVHRFRRLDDDAAGGGTRYACRCGLVRPAV